MILNVHKMYVVVTLKERRGWKKKFMTKKFMYLRDMKRYEKNDSSYRFDEKKVYD